MPRQAATRNFVTVCALTLAIGGALAGKAYNDHSKAQTAHQLRQYARVQAQQIWRGQITGCRRSKKDRADNARGWEKAAEVRQAAWRQAHNPLDLKAARGYREIVNSLRSRTGKNLDCAKVYPKP